MNYREQLQLLQERDSGFAKAVELVKELSRLREPKVINFSHHDVDGVACAFILQRLFRRIGARFTVKMPERFRLLEEDFGLVSKGKVDLLVISDKGTFASYEDFSEKAENILIIDHHTPDGNPRGAVVFNPSVEQHVSTSASLMCHMLATQLSLTDEFDDFVALMGCRADFTFDPVERRCAEFVQPFIVRLMKMFPQLFKTRLGNPTMYDLVDRRRTALINQITEALHVGTLAHYYKEILKVAVSGQDLVLDFLNDLVTTKRPAEFRNLDDFLTVSPSGKIISRVLEFFGLDWEQLESRVRGPIFLGEFRNIGVYMVLAREVSRMQSVPFPAILPYVASTQLEPLKRAFGHRGTMIIVFCPKKTGVHISIRGGGGIIDCSRVCSQLAYRLRRLYPSHVGIEGGGHVDAAECFAGESVPMYSVMRELLWMMAEIFQQGALSGAEQDSSALVLV
ncbi:MAG: DHH family phosphoesterase [Candidatus Hadarchaeum sp.]|uniref:DHH family phosphoesterase n=1 Tax=Candidatus Hadarchaeum sp. TaxID=2883567 RepID=UPI0031786649